MHSFAASPGPAAPTKFEFISPTSGTRSWPTSSIPAATGSRSRPCKTRKRRDIRLFERAGNDPDRPAGPARARLTFVHPATGKELSLTGALPADLRRR